MGKGSQTSKPAVEAPALDLPEHIALLSREEILQWMTEQHLFRPQTQAPATPTIFMIVVRRFLADTFRDALIFSPVFQATMNQDNLSDWAAELAKHTSQEVQDWLLSRRPLHALPQWDKATEDEKGVYGCLIKDAILYVGSGSGEKGIKKRKDDRMQQPKGPPGSRGPFENCLWKGNELQPHKWMTLMVVPTRSETSMQCTWVRFVCKLGEVVMSGLTGAYLNKMPDNYHAHIIWRPRPFSGLCSHSAAMEGIKGALSPVTRKILRNKGRNAKYAEVAVKAADGDKLAIKEIEKRRAKQKITNESRPPPPIEVRRKYHATSRAKKKAAIAAGDPVAVRKREDRRKYGRELNRALYAEQRRLVEAGDKAALAKSKEAAANKRKRRAEAKKDPVKLAAMQKSERANTHRRAEKLRQASLARS